MEKLEDFLVLQVERCNQNLVRFMNQCIRAQGRPVFEEMIFAIEDCLAFFEENTQNPKRSDYEMAKFWFNARVSYMNRLVELREAV